MPDTALSMPDFHELATLFNHCGAIPSPAEWQGYLLGQWAAGHAFDPDDWLAQTMHYCQWATPPNEQDQQVLLVVYQMARDDLESAHMHLHMVLPDDSVALEQRLQALEQWCQGFTIGFAVASDQLPRRERPKDIQEALQDVITLSQIGAPGHDSDAAQNEKDYFLLCHYLGLAALMVYMDSLSPSGHASSPMHDGSPGDDAIRSPAHLFSRYHSVKRTIIH